MGRRGTPEYGAWQNMRARCMNATHPKYASYGGRGITVCERWSDDFDAFLADLGPRPSADHSLDRIDNDGIYEPSNCRWATRSEQQLNRREYGIKLTPEDRAWIRSGSDLVTQRMMADALGVDQSTVSDVLRKVA